MDVENEKKQETYNETEVSFQISIDKRVYICDLNENVCYVEIDLIWVLKPKRTVAFLVISAQSLIPTHQTVRVFHVAGEGYRRHNQAIAGLDPQSEPWLLDGVVI